VTIFGHILAFVVGAIAIGAVAGFVYLTGKSELFAYLFWGAVAIVAAYTLGRGLLMIVGGDA
jgi:hypothetical protein